MQLPWQPAVCSDRYGSRVKGKSTLWVFVVVGVRVHRRRPNKWWDAENSIGWKVRGCRINSHQCEDGVDASGNVNSSHLRCKTLFGKASYARKWWEGKISELFILNAFQPESMYRGRFVAALINIFISKKMKCLRKHLKGQSDYQLPTALQSFSIFQWIALIWLLRCSIKLILVKTLTNPPAKHQTTDKTSHSG